MEVVTWIALVAVLGVLLVVAWRYLSQPDPGRHRSGPVVAAPSRPVLAARRYDGLPKTHLLVGPPIVSDLGVGLGVPVPLRDWLVHYHPGRDNIWADVVADFYTAAARDPVVADYFTGVDLAELQRHFLAALMMLTGNGLTVGAVQQMQARHAGVRNTRGESITPEAYDAAIGVLVDILRARGVPEDALEQLQPLLGPLREAIVVRGDGHSLAS